MRASCKGALTGILFLSIMKNLLSSLLLLAAASTAPPLAAQALPEVADSVTAETDSAAMATLRLTERDYVEVAEELGVEVAAIKAVVDIEAGRSHQGFYAPGLPLINFDLTMFRRFAGKRGINLAKFSSSHAVVFARPNTRKHGSQQRAQQARLDAARTIDNNIAIEGTFWGMFQIGGFNWRKCGAADLDDFVRRMSLSEREQLELFATFLKSTGLDKHLKAKNWRAFARGYNGASYARRGYHTRLAAAYQRHLKEEAKQNPGKSE